MSFGSILIVFTLTLVSQTGAVMYCCRPGCGTCVSEQCALINVCTDLIISRRYSELTEGSIVVSIKFNTCCADERHAVMFESVEEYFEAVAAGEVHWED
ncbi:hypothetical protein VMCG_02100 [Cytospora schulzeri]|uniref:Uncharacterized protein n=1 Tax=Cytospora schulzeri TaxID=448051 RepID=A0A423X3R7_9PEZI|nr:hypothetical protein VMCG_02100 [Valsa malicola]